MLNAILEGFEPATLTHINSASYLPDRLSLKTGCGRRGVVCNMTLVNGGPMCQD